MPDLTLYAAPATCSTVVICALEQAGAHYRLEPVDMARKVVGTRDYHAVNPYGRVPALRADGHLITETVAILVYLADLYPGALLPEPARPMDRVEQISDLCLLSATTHPLVRAVASPHKLTANDAASVRAMGLSLCAPVFTRMDERIDARGWWYGQWSIIDYYAGFLFNTAVAGGLDPSAYPALTGLSRRVAAMPGVEQSAMREEEMCARLALA